MHAKWLCIPHKLLPDTHGDSVFRSYLADQQVKLLFSVCDMLLSLSFIRAFANCKVEPGSRRATRCSIEAGKAKFRTLVAAFPQLSAQRLAMFLIRLNKNDLQRRGSAW